MPTEKIYLEQIEDGFVLKSIYDIDMAQKANIDGSNTIGGVWFIDKILSDKFPNYKQVLTTLSTKEIEYGNVELINHRFLVNNINGIKIKVGAQEGTVWNSLNFDPNTKVDKVQGKGLSTEDFTTALKDKLISLQNYILPIASASVLGGVMVGSGLNIDVNGVLSNSAPNVVQILNLAGQNLSLSSGGGSVVLPFTDWNNIPNKPTTFTPSAHNHIIADVTGLQGALNNKSDLGHTHAWNDITGKPSTFTPSAHVHASSDVNVLTGYVIGANTAISATDSLNAALGKIQAQINSKTNNVGTVTSVGLSAPLGFTVGNSPINTSGLLALSYASGYQGYTTAEANKLASLQNVTSGDHTNVSANKVNVVFEDNKWVKDSQGFNRLRFGGTVVTDDILIRGKYNGSVDFKIQDNSGVSFLELGSSGTLRINKLSSPTARVLMQDGTGGIFNGYEYSKLITSDNINSFIVTPNLQQVLNTGNESNKDILLNIVGSQSATFRHNYTRQMSGSYVRNSFRSDSYTADGTTIERSFLIGTTDTGGGYSYLGSGSYNSGTTIRFYDGDNEGVVRINTRFIPISINGSYADNTGNINLSIPNANDFITSNTNQTGLSGDKVTNGSWEFGNITIRKTGNAGFPITTNSDPNNYINQARLSVITTNNGLHFFGDGTSNSRRMAIQSAHASPLYSANVGILELNPFGGNVKVGAGGLSVETSVSAKNGFFIGGKDNNDIVLAGGLTKPISDFALNSSLNDFLPKAGGTMLGAINFNSGATANVGLDFNNVKKIRFNSQSTVLSGSATGISTGIYFRPQGDSVSAGQVTINGNGLISTVNNGNSKNWLDAYNYSLIGHVPTSRTITINNETFDLSANRTWNIPDTTYSGSISIIQVGTSFQRAALSGDVTAPQNNNVVTLVNSGVVAGTYNNNAAQVRPFTVDAKGRVTNVGAAVPIVIPISNVTNLQTNLNNINNKLSEVQEGVITQIIPNPGAHSVSIQTKKTIVNIPSGITTTTLNISDAPYVGYELAINGCSEFTATVTGNIKSACGQQGNFTITRSSLFWWNGSFWVQAIK